MLDAHPDLAIPPETHFLQDLLGDGKAGAITRKQLFDAATGHFVWPDFHLSADAYRAELDAMEPFDPADGLRCFYSMYAARFGKPRWGDKTPPYGFIMQPIHTLLPEAHFIHVIRDGRDAALSHKSTYFWRYADFEEHATEWRDRIREFREQGEACPYIEIRYEDLVEEPFAVLRGVCEFIELPYRSEMERYHEAAGERMGEMRDLPDYPPGYLTKRERMGIFTLTTQPPVRSRVGRWRTEMAPRDVAAYQSIAGDLLSELGYELDAAGAGPPGAVDDGGRGPAVVVPDSEVRSVTRTWVKLPYRPLPARHMVRELDHWKYFEICRVTLRCGVTGFGETMPFYSWGRMTDQATYKVLGRSAEEVMWDDSLGPGLQQALFDAVGKMRGLPIHRLLGDQCRERVPICWWAIDMPAQDWLAESQAAITEGYTSMKTKGRPWFDLHQQCRELASGLPDGFKVGFDFNGSLLNAARAEGYLRDVRSDSPISVYEEPIPDDDIEDYRTLRGRLDRPVALHSHRPPMAASIADDLCAMFVVSDGGASSIVRQAEAAAAAEKPFWLQQVGSGITAAYSLHFGAVLSHATLPAVTCHQIFAHQLVDPPITVRDGTATVPDQPGLGFELDEDAVIQFRTEPLERDPYPVPGQLIAIRRPSGKISYYAHTLQYWDDFMQGILPPFEEGVYLESIDNDGTKEWADLQGRAWQGGVHTG